MTLLTIALLCAFASGFIVGWILRDVHEQKRAENEFWEVRYGRHR